MALVRTGNATQPCGEEDCAMPFDNLPPQSPINPRADAYALEALRQSREVAARLDRRADITYGTHPLQKLDLYRAKDHASTGMPILMFMHGGGWTHGHKEWCGLNAEPLVDLPMIFVSVNYRLGPEHRLPAAIDDCADALAWLYRHATEFGGDPRRIFIGGHSAGGHLASMLTLQRERVTSRGLPADAVKACFPVSCSHWLDFPDPKPDTTEWRLKFQVLSDPSDGAAMSPLSHVAGNTTPFVLSWASGDMERIRVSGAKMLEALRRERGTVEHLFFEGHDHFSVHLDQRRRENAWVKMIRERLVSR
jgi:acetyl esterase/lipase